MSTHSRSTSALVLATLTVVLAAACAAAAPPRPPAHPVTIRVDVAPDPVRPGGDAKVTIRLEPLDGIKINRYPKLRLAVPAAAGVTAREAELSLGSDAPPAPDAMAKNYFKTIDPLELSVRIDEGASAGDHTLAGTVKFYYCMPSNGFCAPKLETIEIPLTVN